MIELMLVRGKVARTNLCLLCGRPWCDPDDVECAELRRSVPFGEDLTRYGTIGHPEGRR